MDRLTEIGILKLARHIFLRLSARKRVRVTDRCSHIGINYYSFPVRRQCIVQLFHAFRWGYLVFSQISAVASSLKIYYSELLLIASPKFFDKLSRYLSYIE